MRVDRTFSFVDITGFTAYTEEHGDQTAVEALQAFRAVARAAASEHGVRIDKWLGDGAMFVSTQAREMIPMILQVKDDLAAALWPLPLRAGIAGGEVILLEGDDYVGRAVNLAAHLADAARPDRVLATAEAASQAPPGCTSRDAGMLEIRGFPVPIPVYELLPRSNEPVYLAEA